MTAGFDSYTFFMRCADCETMYVPVGDGISLTNGEAVAPYWVRPKMIRKPKTCTHPTDRIEVWIEGAWRLVPYTKET